uniref:Uncharacterized protein n=1 Tax=Rhizophora mucronata TaxID=61149 RepID=A0A2P2PLK9_RHIMU
MLIKETKQNKANNLNIVDVSLHWESSTICRFG